MLNRPLILLYVNHTLHTTAPSGIQRVVTRIAAHLPALADVEFVTWDYSAGQLRYLDARGLRSLYGGNKWPHGVRPNPYAHRVNCRFGDTLPGGRPAWLLIPEIAYHSESGTEVMTRVISMCRQHDVRTAAIFYDAIPISNPNYRSLMAQHACYLAQIARCDRIYAISRYSKLALEKLYARYIEVSDPLFIALARRIVAVPLGEADQAAAAVAPPQSESASRNRILLLGTVEPRKGQIRVLKAFRKIEAADSGNLELHVVGSLHPDVAAEFQALLASSPRVHYRGYVPAAEVDELFSRARFSVFASDDEGFGLPIAESLARGVPCLAANFGAMAETAEGGGCLTVDVRDSRQLTEGMARLMREDSLLHRLRDEIASRTLRTWRDYAGQLAGDVQAASESETAGERRLYGDVRAIFASCLAGDRAKRGEFLVALGDEGSSLRLVVDAYGDIDASAASAPSADIDPPDFHVVAGANSWAGSGIDDAARAACASAWVLESDDTFRRLVESARAAECGHMLPATCVVEQNPSDLIDIASRKVACRIWSDHQRRQTAQRESLLCRLASRWPPARNPSLPLLSIVISTFNRGRFVQENVRWLLGILPRFTQDIRVVVVDNASTDDTLERLAVFAGAPRLTIVSNPVNVGMLGNLRVCSRLMLSRHVWITGDDDFILPSGLAEVIDGLCEHPEIPFAFVNFGVYHRTFFGRDDTVEKLVAERAPLAVNPIRSGVYPIVRIAEQHDNLFTAFYPIVFRSDLLAACFDHPFDGKPFVNLVESVPTTKMLLETYGHTRAYWCGRLGTVGNISNSWSRHLPRWHAVLMPRVFQLAREVGVDPARLHHWSAIHLDLFCEARRKAEAEGAPLDIAPEELDVSYRVFRQPISLP